MFIGKRKPQQTEGRKPPYTEDSSSNDGYKIWRVTMAHNHISPSILVSNMILDSFLKESDIENFRSKV